MGFFKCVCRLKRKRILDDMGISTDMYVYKNISCSVSKLVVALEDKKDQTVTALGKCTTILLTIDSTHLTQTQNSTSKPTTEPSPPFETFSLKKRKFFAKHPALCLLP